MTAAAPGDPALQAPFERVVAEGERRLKRTWPGLLATGTVGGIDISLGIFGLLLVVHATDNLLLGAVAFGIGFIALQMAHSELFTENFMVPIAAVVAQKATWVSVIRLWVGTAVMNLVGGWAMTGILLSGVPALAPTAVKLGSHFPEIGTQWTAFASAILAGTMMTLMTWMDHNTRSGAARIIIAVAIGFLLSAGRLNHAILGALEMFAALHAGAPFGYWDWLTVFLWAALGNIVGGVGLVTMLRLVQVGGDKVRPTHSASS